MLSLVFLVAILAPLALLVLDLISLRRGGSAFRRRPAARSTGSPDTGPRAVTEVPESEPLVTARVTPIGPALAGRTSKAARPLPR